MLRQYEEAYHGSRDSIQADGFEYDPVRAEAHAFCRDDQVGQRVSSLLSTYGIATIGFCVRRNGSRRSMRTRCLSGKAEALLKREHRKSNHLWARLRKRERFGFTQLIREQLVEKLGVDWRLGHGGCGR